MPTEINVSVGFLCEGTIMKKKEDYQLIIDEFHLNESVDVLDEAYFGKQKELDELQKLIGAYRKKYTKKYALIGAAANTDKALLKINRAFEKFFGFGDFALFIIDLANINAFTFAIDNRYDAKAPKDKLVNAKTFKFSKDADFACLVCVYAGLMFNPLFTDEEIMAVILHEIGHNFYASLSTTNAIFSSCNRAVNFAGAVLEVKDTLTDDEQGTGEKALNLARTGVGEYFKLDLLVKKAIKKIKSTIGYTETNRTFYYALYCFYLGLGVADYMSEYLKMMRKIIKITSQTGTGGIKVIAKLWLDRKIETIKDPIHILRMPNGFRNERTADNFAAMYGYGPALHSALTKMENGDLTEKQINEMSPAAIFVSNLFDSLLLPYKLIMMALDPHPLTIQRTTDQIRMLEEELKKSHLDPKMKKRIQKDVDKMNKAVEKSMDTKKGFTGDPRFVTYLFNRIIYNTVEAKSIRDLLFNFDPNGKYKSYDKTIDELCKKNKK